ncbi:MAG: ABC transporter permease [Clostridia bacterium]|nr:ABC transporter permease [Clostridia bacterium]MBR3294758.1 ABC transporter permease [Clostridia bacterium]
MNIISLLKSLPGSVAQGLLWGVLAIGVYITYKVLDYSDMTVDGSMATGAAVCVMLVTGGMNVYLALVIATLAGMAAGLITGLIHTVLGIPAILSGILTQIGLYSINMRILGKSNQAISVDKYDLIVSLRHIPAAIIVGAVFCLAIIAILYWFFGTEVGQSIRATGNNPNMARAQGINTDFNKVLGLMLSNGLVGLAGALYAQYQGSADVNMGRGAIVIGLAAIIMSEVIFGKLFNNFALKLFAVVLGSILYFAIIALVLQLGMSTTDLKLFSAIVVALFLAVPYLKAKFHPNAHKGGKENA